ncbi:MAG TPA: hypothetical protein PK661_02990 [Syntrophorhabdaceae bacterium]|nr:hypothetical protein [Pseudomonadota bacterium]HOS59039.1 hypothetical protein [Syntrophorhabdaceae bacterium]
MDKAFWIEFEMTRCYNNKAISTLLKGGLTRNPETVFQISHGG